MLHWRLINRPRHPLMRLALALLGAALLGGVLVLGFFAIMAFAVIGGIVAVVRAVSRSRSQTSQAPSDTSARVIEGEFAVIHDTRVVRH